MATVILKWNPTFSSYSMFNYLYDIVSNVRNSSYCFALLIRQTKRLPAVSRLEMMPSCPSGSQPSEVSFHTTSTANGPLSLSGTARISTSVPIFKHVEDGLRPVVRGVSKHSFHEEHLSCQRRSFVLSFINKCQQRRPDFC